MTLSQIIKKNIITYAPELSIRNQLISISLRKLQKIIKSGRKVQPRKGSYSKENETALSFLFPKRFPR